MNATFLLLSFLPFLFIVLSNCHSHLISFGLSLQLRNLFLILKFLLELLFLCFLLSLPLSPCHSFSIYLSFILFHSSFFPTFFPFSLILILSHPPLSFSRCLSLSLYLYLSLSLSPHLFFRFFSARISSYRQ